MSTDIDYKQIKQLTKKQITETLFTSVYLPLFVQNMHMFNARWYCEIALSTEVEVDVIDVNGAVILTVPALNPDAQVFISQELTARLQQLNLEWDIDAPRADALSQAWLPHLVQFSGGHADKNRLAWIAILERYGYGDLIVDKPTAEVVQEEVAQIQYVDTGW